MLSAFLALGIIVSLLACLALKHYKIRLRSHQSLLNRVPITAAAMVLGIGIGGFIDGIVFHQILQRHQMISQQIAPVNVVTKNINMFWDGVFHAFSLMVVCIGMVLLWNVVRTKSADLSGRLFSGGLIWAGEHLIL